MILFGSAHRTLILSNLLSLIFALPSQNLDSEIFDLTIGNAPLKKSEIRGDHVEIFSKYGQQFVCMIPKHLPNTTKQERFTNSTAEEIYNVLTKLTALPCILLEAGWWTYSVCIGKTISQYHLQNGEKTSEITLGIYQSEYQWNQADLEDEVKNKYHSQFYGNGDSCDVTGASRTVQLRFFCRPNIDNPTILETTEPETCSYIVKIAASELCDVAALAHPKSAVPYSITCSPSLSDDDFSKYTKAKESRLNEAESAKAMNTFYKLLQKLPSLRTEAVNKRLSQMRSYRKRQATKKIIDAREITQGAIFLLRLIESNFERVKLLRSFPIRTSIKLASLFYPKEIIPPYDIDTAIKFFKANSVNKMVSSLDIGSKAHVNLTLAVASKFITRIRNTFEASVVNRNIPRTAHMVLGAATILKRFGLSKDLLQRSGPEIMRDEPRKSYFRPVSGQINKFVDYVNTGSLTYERQMLKKLNSSIELSQSKLSLMNVRDLLQSIMSSQLLEHEVSFPTSGFMEEAAANANNEDQRVSEEEVSSFPFLGPEEQAAITKALTSSEIQNKMNAIKRSSNKQLHLKTQVHQMTSGLVFMITLGDRSESKSKFHENEANYKFKVDDA